MVKAKYGDRTAIKGNVDQTELLMYGPPEAVVEAVKTCIRDAGVGGGYVCSSSNSIHSGVDRSCTRSWSTPSTTMAGIRWTTTCWEPREWCSILVSAKMEGIRCKKSQPARKHERLMSMATANLLRADITGAIDAP